LFLVFVIVLVVVVVVVVLVRVLVIVVVVCFLFLFLFFFFLLLLSSLLLLLPLHFCLSLVAAEYRQIGCVFALFETLRGKNTINSDAFCVSDAPNHGVYDVFLLLVAITTVFTLFFWDGTVQKHLSLRSFSACCKK
jgi:hypothetical protein